MEFFTNKTAPFTRWIAQSRALQSPFVLIDVGVRDGAHLRWDALGSALEVYGFDADEAAIAQLPPSPSRRYFTLAIGAADRDCEITVPANPYETSVSGAAEGERRIVPMRRLDTLFAENVIPQADFIKLDCEGYEPQIWAGGTDYLNKSNLVGAELETNFNISETLPHTHFWESYQPLLHQRLLLNDIAFNRIALPRFTNRVEEARFGTPPPGVARPSTCSVLLGRDLAAERQSEAYIFRTPERKPTADTILKSAVVMEVHGLNDLAFDLLLEFRATLAPIIDVDMAASLLVPPLSRLGAARSHLHFPHMGLVSSLRTLLK